MSQDLDAFLALLTPEQRALLNALPPEERARLAGATPISNDTVLGDKVAGDKITGDKVAGDKQVNVAIQLGKIVYGHDPEEDQRRRLAWYLEGIHTKFSELPLRGLDTTNRLGHGDGLTLPRIYIELATTRTQLVRSGTPEELAEYCEVDKNAKVTIRPEYHQDYALPSTALFVADVHGNAEQIFLAHQLLVTRAIQQATRLVLLGEPGSGKSTFLRYLAWNIAQRELAPEQAPKLPGWYERKRHLPILLPLRKLAARLKRDGLGDNTVFATLRDEMCSYGTQQIDDALSAALQRGAALLLFDGLDEVPSQGTAELADRATTLNAVRDFTKRYRRCTSVMSCRTRAFDEEMGQQLKWQTATLAPLTMGQIRYFTAAWYGELWSQNHLTIEQSSQLSDKLINSIERSPKLRSMAETPLLLTMMALVLYNQGELPRDRPLLYEKILDLLLGQWDKVRDGQSLTDAIGLPDWGSERIRPLLDRLSYQAHLQASSEDGRGRIGRADLYTALIDFFKAARVAQPGETALRCLDYFEQRSGLLVPDEQDSYVFAHLTLQEHCAGRHIALSGESLSLMMQHRSDDRWREAILLGAGLLRPAELRALLEDLLDPDEQGQPKPPARHQRDLLLASEIGEDRDWNYLCTIPLIPVERLQGKLRDGLVALLAAPVQELNILERMQAGRTLGEIGDPRFPVTLEQWRAEIAKAQAGDTTGYFCRVDAGTYRIGATDKDLESLENALPLNEMTLDKPMWIGRYPITEAQLNVFQEIKHISLSNRMISTTWQAAQTFCSQLSERLSVTLRLPNEEEWEIVARGQASLRYPWGDQRPTHISSSIEQIIGLFPNLASPCGAQDLRTITGEWTSTSWKEGSDTTPSFESPQGYIIRGRMLNEQGQLELPHSSQRFFGDQHDTANFRVVLELE